MAEERKESDNNDSPFIKHLFFKVFSFFTYCLLEPSDIAEHRAAPCGRERVPPAVTHGSLGTGFAATFYLDDQGPDLCQRAV